MCKKVTKTSLIVDFQSICPSKGKIIPLRYEQLEQLEQITKTVMHLTKVGFKLHQLMWKLTEIYSEVFRENIFICSFMHSKTVAPVTIWKALKTMWGKQPTWTTFYFVISLVQKMQHWKLLFGKWLHWCNPYFEKHTCHYARNSSSLCRPARKKAILQTVTAEYRGVKNRRKVTESPSEVYGIVLFSTWVRGKKKRWMEGCCYFECSLFLHKVNFH